jgi:short-subunit dehydrogenase
MLSPKSILITGASSGIGEALALAYAGPGVALALLGRDQVRLVRVAEACSRAGSHVEYATIDVADAKSMAEWIEYVHAQHPVDLVIANAGISGGTSGGTESESQTRRITEVNVEGVINTVLPLIPRMAQRQRGQIALMSSIASFRGLPGAPAYCASKAYIRVWGEALRPDLERRGITVSVICPGFVVSRMTATNKFRMPLLMPADHAARIIVEGLKRGKARISFPWRLYAVVQIIAALPQSLIDPLMRRLPSKT